MTFGCMDADAGGRSILTLAEKRGAKHKHRRINCLLLRTSCRFGWALKLMWDRRQVLSEIQMILNQMAAFVWWVVDEKTCYRTKVIAMLSGGVWVLEDHRTPSSPFNWHDDHAPFVRWLKKEPFERNRVSLGFARSEHQVMSPSLVA